jgi:hypothetical protein
MQISTIGFLGVFFFEKENATRGALLVTAMDTKPLEFRITAPVCPQNFQTILYGELLKEYIAVDLVGCPLLNAIENKPDLILVQDDLLLGISSKQEIPMLRIMKADEAVIKKGIQPEPLNPLDASHQPAKVYTSQSFSGSLKTITEQLQVVFSQRDLIEPFERLERACSDVHNRKRDNK